MVKVQGSSDQLLSTDVGRVNTPERARKKKCLQTVCFHEDIDQKFTAVSALGQMSVFLYACVSGGTGQRSKVPAYSYALLPLAKPGAVALLSDLGVG